MEWLFESKFWAWLVEHKEWLFPGFGLVVLGWIALFFKWLWGKETPKAAQNGDDIQIEGGSNVAVTKDRGKAVQVKNAQTGVISDNVNIEGGIHIYHAEKTGKITLLINPLNLKYKSTEIRPNIYIAAFQWPDFHHT